MKWAVFSRREMQRYAWQEHNETSIVISINSSCELFLEIPYNSKNGIKKLLSLSFDDITDDTYSDMVEECPEYVTEHSAVLMSKQDAARIVAFVKKYKDSVDGIIVHCDAGVSRSAGIMAAIMKWLTGDDSKIFNDLRFHPNMWCYRLVLNEFMKEEEN